MDDVWGIRYFIQSAYQCDTLGSNTCSLCYSCARTHKTLPGIIDDVLGFIAHNTTTNRGHVTFSGISEKDHSLSYERVVKVHRYMACSIGGSYFFPPFGLKEKLQVQIRYLLQQELVQPVAKVGRNILIFAFSTTSLCFCRGGKLCFSLFFSLCDDTQRGVGVV